MPRAPRTLPSAPERLRAAAWRPAFENSVSPNERPSVFVADRSDAPSPSPPRVAQHESNFRTRPGYRRRASARRSHRENVAVRARARARGGDRLSAIFVCFFGARLAREPAHNIGILCLHWRRETWLALDRPPPDTEKIISLDICITDVIVGCSSTRTMSFNFLDSFLYTRVASFFFLFRITFTSALSSSLLTAICFSRMKFLLSHSLTIGK